MKRYAFPLTIILLLFAVIALAAPGDKRPAVTSAAIGLGSSSSPTLASVTATTSVTAPAFNSTAADGYHYVLPYNSVAFAGTPSVGMMQTTPTGPQWYTGSAWEAIGGTSLPSQTGNSGKYLTTNGTAASWASIAAGSCITISTDIPTDTGAAYLNDSTHVLTIASTTGYTQFTGSFTTWDTTPAAFSFTDLTDVALSTTQTATPVQITGINYPSAVTATGGTAAICTGATADTCGEFSASPGNITNNQYVSARHTSSDANSIEVQTTVTIGGVSDVFSSTTVATVGAYSISDNFNRTAQNPLVDGIDTSSTPTSTWAAASGYNPMQIITNYARGTVASSNNASVFVYHPWASNQYSQATLAAVGGTPAVIVRGSTSSGAFYRLSALATYYQIHKCTSAGTCTQLGSNYTAHAPTVGDVIKLSVTGTSTVTLTPTIAGTDYSAVTDSDSPITSGSPGIYQGSSNGNIDNWSGGEL